MPSLTRLIILRFVRHGRLVSCVRVAWVVESPRSVRRVRMRSIIRIVRGDTSRTVRIVEIVGVVGGPPHRGIKKRKHMVCVTVRRVSTRNVGIGALLQGASRALAGAVAVPSGAPPETPLWMSGPLFRGSMDWGRRRRHGLQPSQRLLWRTCRHMKMWIASVIARPR